MIRDAITLLAPIRAQIRRARVSLYARRVMRELDVVDFEIDAALRTRDYLQRELLMARRELKSLESSHD